MCGGSIVYFWECGLYFAVVEVVCSGTILSVEFNVFKLSRGFAMVEELVEEFGKVFGMDYGKLWNWSGGTRM